MEKTRVILHPVPKVAVRDDQVGCEEFTPPVLTRSEIHVYYLDLASGHLEVGPLRGTLSPDELERAARFRFDADQKDFIHTRGTLRRLLGSYLHIAPHELRFAYSEYGRPMFATSVLSDTLDFNVSHTAGLALLAFARGRKIGVDVEKVRRDFGTAEIAERFFSMAERSALRELPEQQRHDAFFRCWTRKEAFIKALGEGLSHPLDQFDVSLTPGRPAALLATRPDAEEVTSWSLWDIQVPGGYVAALAAESQSSSP
jgi:4'-phosphopantetheinyl transferase